MKRLMMVATITLLTMPDAFAGNGTCTGTISGSTCGRSHETTIARRGGTMTGAQCVEACLPAGAMQGSTITASMITMAAISAESRAGAPAARGTGSPANSAIDAVSEINNSVDKAALVGRSATFTHVKVQRVAGARSFWAGDSRRQRVFVVVDATDLAQAVQPARGLKNGDVVAIDGTIERVPGSLGQVKVTSWGRLDDKDATALSERDVYVYAKSVKVLAR